MAVHVLKFVDSIAASPTTRLDVNDGVVFSTTDFDASPPRLRRAMSQNAMSDGGFVSSSAYEMRVVKATLLLNRSTQDLSAAQLQLLARELDRADNYLMFQPDGLTKPVFFRTVRSDFNSVREVPTDSMAARVMEFECLAEPFALGLRESLGPYTINNDPAHATNGCYVDLTGVIGDVAAPAYVYGGTKSVGRGVLSVRQHGSPADLVWWAQAESMTLGIDTTNPGGGPDAAMSGTGTNNYVTTSFATDATMETRLTWDLDALLTTDSKAEQIRGTYRVLAVVRRTDNTSDIALRVGSNTKAATLKITSTYRQVVDLGLVSLGSTAPPRAGHSANALLTTVSNLTIGAERTSGAGSVQWDFVALLPADESQCSWTAVYDTSGRFLMTPDEVLTLDTTDPFSGSASAVDVTHPVTGGFPELVPGRTNRLFFLELGDDATSLPAGFSSDAQVMVKGASNAVTVHYWPAYLYVRPATT